MKEYILLTGASSGIGYEMAKQLASKNYNLLLVARSEDKLSQLQRDLQKQYPVEVEYFLFDLAEPNSASDLYQLVKEKNYLVTGLINNAGFGDYGNFVEMPLKKDEEMIAVNITALVGLTKLFGADMVKAGKGRIMNVASLLSFLPFPYYSIYSATKCFVLAFTETLAAELEGTGVSVTALCPGTVETPFHTEAMRKTNAMSANKPMPSHAVAQAGVELFLNGQGKKVVGFMNWFLSNLPRVSPDKMMMKIKKNLASIKP
ncbi:SDR family oxidoreductase [Cytophagales bacterium LB-30]|uniref:SDR family oxidoreductase n=1 Tax=Shiella aurantiaca TaxID=3058365 RepID=A0ABT8F931_9BACT|nr:SDR family oxidoreductase [Shiella aurantiaca]MDN4166706.1 SDR family oxidoreductase [Shiella aurantiaca]